MREALIVVAKVIGLSAAFIAAMIGIALMLRYFVNPHPMVEFFNGGFA